MTHTSVRRSLVATTAAVALALLLSGCIFSPQPHQTPTDPGIPEARAVAAAQLAEMRTRLVLSDRVIVLGDVQQDNCDTAENWWFDDTRDLGYRCESAWTAIAVIPDARTPHETAAAVDAEMGATDLPFSPGGMVRDVMSVYPPVRQDAEIVTPSAGGHEGPVAFRVVSYEFRPAEWNAPWEGNVTVGRTVGTSVADITAADIMATGANQVIEFAASVEYWNTTGLPDLDDVGPPDAVGIETWRYGGEFVLELADWAPAEEPIACIADPAVDEAAIVRVDEPFPYLRAPFVLGALPADRQRVADCVLAALESGTVVMTSPGD
ncbi:hypothetical protein [Microterricola viridarii]|uniref:hypothetical protein n=1 Tax=Microterricola viridarii TaxID=412690 RepID=UPI0012EA22A6|nr:hypothetical protein [Microterricola viridarii]